MTRRNSFARLAGGLAAVLGLTKAVPACKRGVMDWPVISTRLPRPGLAADVRRYWLGDYRNALPARGCMTMNEVRARENSA